MFDSPERIFTFALIIVLSLFTMFAAVAIVRMVSLSEENKFLRSRFDALVDGCKKHNSNEVDE